jgi:aldose 1-epimerase
VSPGGGLGRTGELLDAAAQRRDQRRSFRFDVTTIERLGSQTLEPPAVCVRKSLTGIGFYVISEADRSDPQIRIRGVIRKAPESVRLETMDPGESDSEYRLSLRVEPTAGLDPFEQQSGLLAADHTEHSRDRKRVGGGQPPESRALQFELLDARPRPALQEGFGAVFEPQPPSLVDVTAVAAQSFGDRAAVGFGCGLEKSSCHAEFHLSRVTRAPAANDTAAIRSIRDHPVMALRAIRIESGSGLSATFVPEAGMIGVSLRRDGDELLGQRRGIESYVESGKTMGLPLLYPWANRLSNDSYEFSGRRVELTGAFGVRRDGNGLPIHGTLAASPLWVVDDASTTDQLDSAKLSASLDFGDHPELLETFPFPHRLDLEVSVEGSSLKVRSTVTPTGEVPVPLAYGFHPYLTLPGTDRSEWRIALPEMTSLEFDGRGIPDGRTGHFPAIEKPLGHEAWDRGFNGLEEGAEFSVADSRTRITVTFNRGYPAAQVFAPADESVICFEPMKAPTNALVDGRHLDSVAPGETDVSSFTITADRLEPAEAGAKDQSDEYRLDRQSPPASEIRRVARGRVESAVRSLREADPATRPDAVHEARKDMKKMRAVLRLVREEVGSATFRSENRRYRDAARLLSDSRDAEVLVETVESLGVALPGDAPPLDPMIDRLRAGRDARSAEGSHLADHQLLEAARTIEEGGRVIDQWDLTASDWQLFAGGLRRTYRDGRRGLDLVETDATPENVHEWRKRVKDLWYQLRLLRNSWKSGLKANVREADRLAQLLGDYNDLSILLDELTANQSEDPATPFLKSIATARQAELLAEALPLGRRIYAEKPGQFAGRIGAYWSA